MALENAGEVVAVALENAGEVVAVAQENAGEVVAVALEMVASFRVVSQAVFVQERSACHLEWCVCVTWVRQHVNPTANFTAT